MFDFFLQKRIFTSVMYDSFVAVKIFFSFLFSSVILNFNAQKLILSLYLENLASKATFAL